MGPDISAISLFLKGCNFKCPYCINNRLIDFEIDRPLLKFDDIKDILSESKWVMISGGEPTCHPMKDLIDLIEKIKSLGCKVGMATNGYNIDKIRALMKYLNYMALDFKIYDAHKYESLLIDEFRIDYEYVLSTVIHVAYLLRHHSLDESHDFDYEVRTTMYRPMIDQNSLRSIAMLLPPNTKWVWQKFRPVKNMPLEESKDILPYDETEIIKMMESVKTIQNNICYRYI